MGRAEEYKKLRQAEVTMADGNPITVRAVYPFDFADFGDVPEEFVTGKVVTAEELKIEKHMKFFDELMVKVLCDCTIPQDGFKIVRTEPGQEKEGEISYKSLDPMDQILIMNKCLELSPFRKEHPANAGRFPGKEDKVQA
jgi:hypothetical protein